MKTKVVFRKGPASHGGEILAIFPEIAATHTGADCLCYAHTGQHGACTPFIHRKGYRLATPEEYAPLKRELESIGYSLHVVNVISPAMTRARISSVTR